MAVRQWRSRCNRPMRQGMAPCASETPGSQSGWPISEVASPISRPTWRPRRAGRIIKTRLRVGGNLCNLLPLKRADRRPGAERWGRASAAGQPIGTHRQCRARREFRCRIGGAARPLISARSQPCAPGRWTSLPGPDVRPNGGDDRHARQSDHSRLMFKRPLFRCVFRWLKQQFVSSARYASPPSTPC